MTVARKPGHRGEHEISRKPLRREGRIASAEPVCSCAFFCAFGAHETAGAARTRLSLRPLVHSEGANRRKARTHRAARMRTHILSLFDIRICISEKPVTSGVPDGGHGAIAPLPTLRFPATSA